MIVMHDLTSICPPVSGHQRPNRNARKKKLKLGVLEIQGSNVKLARCDAVLMFNFLDLFRSDHSAVADSFPEPRGRKHADDFGRCPFNRYL